MDALNQWLTDLVGGNPEQLNIVETLMRLLSELPIVPIIFAGFFLKRLLTRQAPAERAPEPAPPSAYASDRRSAPANTRTGSFSERHGTPEEEPSAPLAYGSIFDSTGEKTKFGFDDKEWGSTYGSDWASDRDAEPRIQRGG